MKHPGRDEIEQAIRGQLAAFAFAPNDAGTWRNVEAVVKSFLDGLWRVGGLYGSKPSDAYTVEVGLGRTMTEEDVVEGWMIVQVTLQLERPAEFIELVIRQRMET